MSSSALTSPASLRGSHDALADIRVEDANSFDTFHALYGSEVGSALRHAPTLVGRVGWREAVAVLRGGLIVSHECASGASSTGPRRNHLLFFHPDGTVSALNHRARRQPAVGPEGADGARPDDTIAALDAVLAAHAAQIRAERDETTALRMLAAAPSGETSEQQVERQDRARTEQERQNTTHATSAAKRASELRTAAAAVLDAGVCETSNTLDLDALQTLHALGAPIPACERIALWLVHANTDPLGPGALVGDTFDLTHGWLSKHRFAYTSTLYAAVMWAQEPTWPRGAGQRFLNHGITPAALRAWVARGWTVHDAAEWLARSVPFDRAELWRAAGDTSARAARLAGLGEEPSVAEQDWIAVGFAPGESDQWRARSEYGRIPRLQPAEAYEWHRHGVVPNSVYDFERLPVTPEEAAEATEEWHRKSASRRRDGSHFPGRIPTRQRALEWTSAGVPSEMVLSWCRKVGDDDAALAAALEWARIIPAAEYALVADWNTAHPDARLTSEHVTRLRRLGLATHGENMSRLIATGLDNTDILRPITMLPAGKRWLGLDLRRHLTEAATLHNERTKAGRPGSWEANSKAPEQILTGKWDRIAWSLRGIWHPNNVQTWRHVIDWFATDPTPPPPYGSGSPR
jgi:hypothetical protein